MGQAVLVRELGIQGFRGIRRLAKSLRLEKLNVLIGRNNAGKTSILEALFLLAEPYVEKSPAETPRLPQPHLAPGRVEAL